MPNGHRDDCATHPREDARSLSRGFSQRWLQQSGGPQSSLTGNEAMQSTCHGELIEGGRNTRLLGAFARSRRVFSLDLSKLPVFGRDFTHTLAQFLCAAQQLSECKFWVRTRMGSGAPQI
jgi:hypothetical protein